MQRETYRQKHRSMFTIHPAPPEWHAEWPDNEHITLSCGFVYICGHTHTHTAFHSSLPGPKVSSLKQSAEVVRLGQSVLSLPGNCVMCSTWSTLHTYAQRPKPVVHPSMQLLMSGIVYEPSYCEVKILMSYLSWWPFLFCWCLMVL